MRSVLLNYVFCLPPLCRISDFLNKLQTIVSTVNTGVTGVFCFYYLPQSLFFILFLLYFEYLSILFDSEQVSQYFSGDFAFVLYLNLSLQHLHTLVPSRLCLILLCMTSPNSLHNVSLLMTFYYYLNKPILLLFYPHTKPVERL